MSVPVAAKTYKAVWNGVVVAESANTVKFAGQIYFPPDSVKSKFLEDSTKHTTCPFKGTASYKTIKVKGQENPNAAWYYPEPKDAAKQIAGYFAFWKGVKVEWIFLNESLIIDKINYVLYCFSLCNFIFLYTITHISTVKTQKALKFSLQNETTKTNNQHIVYLSWPKKLAFDKE